MSIKVLASNRKAFHNYHISDKFEAGVALTGPEVKSLRAGKANLTDGWVDIDGWSITLKDVHISPYSHGNRENPPEKRDRQLLMHKREIAKLGREINEKGLTVVPTKIYFKGRYIKVEIALAKGKKQFDKRESAKKQDANRAMARAMKRN